MGLFQLSLNKNNGIKLSFSTLIKYNGAVIYGIRRLLNRDSKTAYKND
jgi:hypothetical protein